MATLLAFTGLILLGAGAIWLLIITFTESVLWGLLSLLLPVVGLIFVALNWQITKRAFVLELVGGLMFFGGMLLGHAGAHGA
jgi:hypothetical protein